VVQGNKEMDIQLDSEDTRSDSMGTGNVVNCLAHWQDPIAEKQQEEVQCYAVLKRMDLSQKHALN